MIMCAHKNAAFPNRSLIPRDIMIRTNNLNQPVVSTYGLLIYRDNKITTSISINPFFQAFRIVLADLMSEQEYY